MNKEKFCKALNVILDYHKELDKLEEILNCDIWESSICEQVNILIDELVASIANYKEDIIDDINWWLYEDVEKEWTLANGTVVSVKTPEELYDAIQVIYSD